MILARVRYGKADTPKDKREYRINNKGPVGTLKEVTEMFPHLAGDFEVWERCARCKVLIEPGMEALSRTDSSIILCSDCATKQALQQYIER